MHVNKIFGETLSLKIICGNLIIVIRKNVTKKVGDINAKISKDWEHSLQLKYVSIISTFFF